MQPQQALSYKDPSGFVVKSEGGYARYIAGSYSKEYEHLMVSGLYADLVEKKLLIKHLEVDNDLQFSGIYKKIYPDQLDFISMPFEWTFKQWQTVLTTYLEINLTALKYGMILKDATPYNFAFHQNNCILFDTLSFDFYEDGKPWMAYRRFCEELLSPFLLLYYKGLQWLRLFRSEINGFPLPFVSNELPKQTRLNSICLLHIHLHAKFGNKAGTAKKTESNLSIEKLNVLFTSLQKFVKAKNKPVKYNSHWDDYYDVNIESADYLKDKENIVTGWLKETAPNAVVDLGANTGKFSFIATRLAKQVYAVESDPACVEIINDIKQQSKVTNVITAVADVADPSPGLGWLNQERPALLDRLKGDMVMGLALIHHLCLSRNLPLNFVAELFARITTKFALVEFVPKTDSKSQILLKSKPDIYIGYAEDDFIRSFEVYFKVKQVHQCNDSQRKLFLFEKC